MKKMLHCVRKKCQITIPITIAIDQGKSGFNRFFQKNKASIKTNLKRGYLRPFTLFFSQFHTDMEYLLMQLSGLFCAEHRNKNHATIVASKIVLNSKIFHQNLQCLDKQILKQPLLIIDLNIKEGEKLKTWVDSCFDSAASIKALDS